MEVGYGWVRVGRWGGVMERRCMRGGEWGAGFGLRRMHKHGLQRVLMVEHKGLGARAKLAGSGEGQGQRGVGEGWGGGCGRRWGGAGWRAGMGKGQAAASNFTPAAISAQW